MCNGLNVLEFLIFSWSYGNLQQVLSNCGHFYSLWFFRDVVNLRLSLLFVLFYEHRISQKEITCFRVIFILNGNNVNSWNCHMPGIYIFYLVLTRILWSRYCYHLFKNEDTEKKKEYIWWCWNRESLNNFPN